MDIVILEGARGTGKSTVGYMLRQKQSGTTLVNCTGFKGQGRAGLEKISDYYDAWYMFLKEMSSIRGQNNIIFDRFFYSEQVFSSLYKDYDFSRMYMLLSQRLSELTKHRAVRIRVVFFTIYDKEELATRLQRDKVPFAHVQESVEESMRQQDAYHVNFSNYGRFLNGNFQLIEVDTTGKTSEQVYEAVELLLQQSDERKEYVFKRND